MIKLCGFAVSNYYNKIKLILLEKGIEFTEELVTPSQDAALLKRSPLGKIPFIETERGCLTESQAILEYLEDTYPAHPIYPADTFERAKCRELIHHLELNIEMHARRLYKEAFFGGTVSDETKEQVKELLDRGLKGVGQLAKFSPYITGEHYSAADCVALLHFYFVGLATKKVFGTDLVALHIPQAEAYLQLLETRPAVQKVVADRAAAFAQFLK